MKHLLFLILTTLFCQAAGAQMIIRRAAPPAGGFVVGHARVAANTSTGNQPIAITWSDGGSYTPTAAEFWIVRASVDATNAANFSGGIGAATSTTERWAIAGAGEDAQATMDTYSYTTDANCIALIDPTGTASVEALADFVSFGTDDVTVNWSTAPGTGYYVHVTAFTGTDGAVAGTVDPDNTDTGTVDVTTLGASANYAMVSTAGESSTWAETIVAKGIISKGAYSFDGSTARQATVLKAGRDNTASQIAVVGWSNTLAGIMTAASGEVLSGGWALSNHASGVTVTTTIFTSRTNTNQQLGYLLLDLPAGTDAYVGNFTTPTSTGNQSITDPGFTTQAVSIFATHSNQPSSDTSDNREQVSPDADGISIGTGISSTSEFSFSPHEDDGASTSDTNSRSSSVIAVVLETTGGVALQADVFSLDASGFTVNHTTVDGTGRTWVYVAFEQ